MKRLLVVLIATVLSIPSYARLVCDKVWMESEFAPSGKTLVDRNCRYTKGDVEPYYGSTLEEGEVSRITKHPDGTVTVYRAGRPGEREEWKEKSPGEWSRVR